MTQLVTQTSFDSLKYLFSVVVFFAVCANKCWLSRTDTVSKCQELPDPDQRNTYFNEVLYKKK